MVAYVPHDLDEMVLQYFNGDHDKVLKWFHTENPMLGNITPFAMIEANRVERLRKFITEALKENDYE